MARELLTQVELLEAACHRALKAEGDAATREALVTALAAYALPPDVKKSPPFVRGLANMVRVHAEHLAHRLKTEADDPVGRRAKRAALEQICKSLGDLHEALLKPA